VLIDRGVIRFDGRPAEAVAEFRRYRPEPTAAADRAAADTPIRITSVQLLHPAGDSSPLFVTGRPFTVRVTYHASEVVVQPQVAIDIHNVDGVYCAGINTRMDNCDLGRVSGDGQVDLVIPKLALLPGAYSISVGLLDAVALRTYDLHLRAYPFSVLSDRRDYGIVYLEHDWHGGAVPEVARAGRAAGTAMPRHGALAAAGEESK
jgi:hypothetical protein